VLSDNFNGMTSRLHRSRFAAFLACLFGLLLLVGTPMRPVQLSPASSGGKAVAMQMAADDLAADDSGNGSLEDNTGSGMDDILHPFDLAHRWEPMPHQAPRSLHGELSLHDPARLLRPPELA
jgi:hypothetical protein